MRHSTVRARRRGFTATGAVAVLALLAPAASAQAQEGHLSLFGRHYSVIVGATVFVPTDSDTRSVYGDRTIGPSLGLWSFTNHRGLGLSWDVAGRRMKEDTRRADVLQAGLGPRLLLRDADTGFAPYLTVRGDAYGIHLDHEDWRVRPGGNVELGASVLRHVVLGVRYDLVGKIDGVDLSGASARLAVKLF